MKKKKRSGDFLTTLPKCPTGITGFDEITLGGLPAGRSTLVCGGPGCGKTLFGLEFLVRGARDFGEPGVCITFEEEAPELAKNVRSLGFDLVDLVRRKKLVIDYIELDRDQIAETGEYDLEGLFIRIGSAIAEVGAKRVLLDTPETLFAGLSDQGLLRSEMRRLFAWLKEKGVTAVITGERGEGTLTRNGLEEYISDCVVLLDHRVHNSVVTRRLRVLKYRGSSHGTNEYPFLIDENGMSVLPVTSLGLEHDVSSERISSGIPALDEMLGGRGFYRGSSILLTGAAGTGKTSVGGHFVDAACARGESALYFSFEESPRQLMRNMASIGLGLEKWVKRGLLHIESTRPATWGHEMHLVRMHKCLREFRPRVVVVDPISALVADLDEARSLLLRIVDYLKQIGATAVFSSVMDTEISQRTEIEISSVMDSWIQLRNAEANGERNRLLYVMKSRGMAHSNQMREFLMTSQGVHLREVYLGPGGVHTGSARLAQEAREREERLKDQRNRKEQKVALERTLQALESQIQSLHLEKQIREREMASIDSSERSWDETQARDREEMARSRSGRQSNGKTRTQR